MTIDAWLLALVLTLPIGFAALCVGIKASQTSTYWTVALGLIALPLALSPILPWLVLQAPSVLETLGPIFVGQGDSAPPTDFTSSETQAGFDVMLAIFWIWMLGAGARLCFEARRSLRLTWLTGQAQPADEALAARADRLAKRAGLSMAGIYTHCGPTMVTGLLHGRLYLNEAELASPVLD